MIISIKKPNDSREYYETEATSKDLSLPTRATITFERNHKDPVHAGITKFWKNLIARRNGYTWCVPTGNFSAMLMIKSCPIIIGRSGSRLKLQGQYVSLQTMASALARLTYKSCFEENAEKLMLSLYSTLNLPENVRYCLENKVPYHFYEDFSKIEVRLNCQQIGDNEFGIEVSDGVWGTLTAKELDVYCNFYLNGNERSKKWKRLSPKKLYSVLVGKTPTESDLKVMVAFLQQNRMGDIVERRAMQLVEEMLVQHKERLIPFFTKNGRLEHLIVKGKLYDWRLSARGNDSYTTTSLQSVSTYLLQEWEKDDIVKKEWRGPICIDNMAKGSPLGDQFATRALALLNDNHTIKIVSTINSYIVNSGEDNIRVDENVLRELRENS